MKLPAKLAWGLLAVCVVVVMAAWYALSGSSAPQPSTFAGFPPFSIENPRFTGTASCSGRACHGSLEPSGERTGIRGNEHTTWLTRDRHADAYRVLFNERSLRIVRVIDASIPAHEN